MGEKTELHVYIPDELHHAVKIRAAEERVPMSQVVTALLRMWLAGRIRLPEGEEEPA